MPKLKPLKEWICDTCGGTVAIDNGWVEWLSPNGRPEAFRICHNRITCAKHGQHPDLSDLPLKDLVGADGLQNLLSMLDVGRVLDPLLKYIPLTPELTSYTDTIRRLHIPYYEEARQYFAKAVSDGWFADSNEVGIFVPSTCEAIIKRYE